MHTTTGSALNASVLGQLLLMQSVLDSLPDDAAIRDFVCRGLSKMPGVVQAHWDETSSIRAEDASVQCFPLMVGKTRKGEICLSLSDSSAFSPYQGYMSNFCFMVAVILEAREQRQSLMQHRAELEKRVEERTAQLLRKVAEQVRTEAALRESEQKFHNIFDSSSDAIFIHDLEGHFLEVNASACQRFGYSREELLQMTPADIDSQASAALVPGRIEAIKAKLQLVFESDARCKDGREIPVEVNGRLIEYAGNPGILSVVRDVSERKRAEAEKELLQLQLIQAQKMESVGRLAGGVAHDFNNMLGVILGHMEMALEQVDPALPLHADLMEVLRAAERSADLTRQLLAFARKQTIVPKQLDLNETVDGMLKMLRRLIGENIDLIWQPGQALRPIMIDPAQIDQILANLCVNARDAIAGAGRIVIQTGNTVLNDEFHREHAGMPPGAYVLLTVSDNGRGIDREILSDIFEPFFTTKEVGKGTGLGLATVYGIVQQNNGFIHVGSTPGQGTSFMIYLPVDDSQPALPQETVCEWVPTPGHETILLVEDEPAVLRMTTKMLEHQGYTVLTAGSPHEGLRLMKEHAGSIDLLMTDVVMPEMNGFELADTLLASFPNLKRLFMSGYTNNYVAHSGVAGPGVQFIQKPFTMRELLGKLREVLDSPLENAVIFP